MITASLPQIRTAVKKPVTKKQVKHELYIDFIHNLKLLKIKQ